MSEDKKRKLKKERKLRTIKNSPVDLEVSVPPGLHFKNWQPFVVAKLKERESFITEKRLSAYRSIIEQGLAQQRDELHFVEFDSILAGIRRDFTTETQRDISEWRVPTTMKHSKRRRSIFRDYFHCCKNSWDQRKVKLLFHHLLLPMMQFAQRIFGADSSQFHSALRGLLEARIVLPNCRNPLMIPMGVWLSLVHSFPVDLFSSTNIQLDVIKTLFQKKAKRGSRIREYMLQCLRDMDRLSSSTQQASNMDLICEPSLPMQMSQQHAMWSTEYAESDNHHEPLPPISAPTDNSHSNLASAALPPSVSWPWPAQQQLAHAAVEGAGYIECPQANLYDTSTASSQSHSMYYHNDDNNSHGYMQPFVSSDGVCADPLCACSLVSFHSTDFNPNEASSNIHGAVWSPSYQQTVDYPMDRCMNVLRNC